MNFNNQLKNIFENKILKPLGQDPDYWVLVAAIEDGQGPFSFEPWLIFQQNLWVKNYEYFKLIYLKIGVKYDIEFFRGLIEAFKTDVKEYQSNEILFMPEDQAKELKSKIEKYGIRGDKKVMSNDI